jgi:hypothetical protein
MKFLPTWLVLFLAELFYNIRFDWAAQKFAEERNRRNRPWVG